MKTFSYRDSNGDTKFGIIHDNDFKGVDFTDDIFSRPACVLKYHLKLDMILILAIWIVITFAFGAEINFFAWMIGGFVCHIVKNIIRLATGGIRAIIPKR